MPNKLRQYLLFTCVLLIFSIQGSAQKLISYKATNEPLNAVLAKVATQGNVRFAFDDDYMSRIKVTFDANNIQVEDFLKLISGKYKISYRLIGNSWVLAGEEKTSVSANQQKKENQPKKIAKVTEKKPAKVNRLWNFMGIIIDSRTGNRLLNATIYIDNLRKTKTNTAGFFEEEVSSTGELQIKLNHWGYHPLDTTILLNDTVDISLKVVPLLIAGQLPGSSYSDFPVYPSTASGAFSMNLSAGTNPGGKDITDYFNYFGLIPEVTLQMETGLEVRESSYAPENIYIDGIPLMNLSHLNGQLSPVNAQYIHQGSVSRGGLSSAYANNSSGYIDLIGRNGFVKPMTETTFTPLNTSLYIGIPITPKVALSGALRKSTFGMLPNFYSRKLITPRLRFLQNNDIAIQLSPDSSTIDYYDLNAKISIQPNTRSEVNIVYYGANDKTEQKYIPSTQGKNLLSTYSKWNSHSAGITYRKVADSKQSDSFTISILKTELKNGFKSVQSNETAENIISIDNGNKLLKTHLNWTTSLRTSKIAHIFGAETDFYQTSFSNKEKEKKPDEPTSNPIEALYNIKTNSFTAFYEASYNPSNWLTISAGTRGTFLSAHNSFSAQPRIAVDVKPSEKISLYLRSGREIMPLYRSLAHSYSELIAPSWTLINKYIPVFSSWQHIAGIEYFTNAIAINAEFYQTNEKNHNTILFGQKGSQIVNQSGKKQGADVMAHYRTRHFQHSLSYCFVHTDYKLSTTNKAFTKNTHSLKLTEMYRLNGWKAAAHLSYISGRENMLPWVLPGQIVAEPYSPEINSMFSISYQLAMKKGLLETGITVLNLLNKKEIIHQDFYRTSTPTTISRIDIVQNPTLPTFFVTWKLK